MRREKSQIMSHAVVPICFEISSKLQAIRENGEVLGLPFTLQDKTWNPKPLHWIREGLLAVRDKKDAAAFLVYAGYVVMLETDYAVPVGIQWLGKPEEQVSTTLKFEERIRAEQVSDTLMAYVLQWRDACREILTTTYRHPAKPKGELKLEELELGAVSVRDLARRGTGRFNEIPVTFTWDTSGRPMVTVRPATRLEAVVLSCHLDKSKGVKFRQCRICEEVFEITDPRKRFCSPEHAHLAVVRRGRRSAKPYPRRTRRARRF